MYSPRTVMLPLQLEIPQLESQQVIMTLIWVMVTGAVIWIIDNFFKGFENVMEDGFRRQARNINDSVRVNVTLLLLSLSVFIYFRFYLKEDTSQLTGLLGALIDLLASVGKFILYLLAFAVYGGYELIDGNYKPGRPESDEGVLLGFVIILSYVVVKRLFFRKVPPILWAVIVAGVMLGFNFFAKQTGFDLKNTFKGITQKVDDMNTDDDSPFQPKDSVEEKNQPMVEKDSADENKKEQKRTQKPVNTSISDEEVMVLNEQLNTAIENFDYLNRRTEPRREDYIDDEAAYQDAVLNHISELQNSDAYKKIINLTEKFEEQGILNHKTIALTLQDELCEYYQIFFNEKICPTEPFAN